MKKHNQNKRVVKNLNMSRYNRKMNRGKSLSHRSKNKKVSKNKVIRMIISEK